MRRRRRRHEQPLRFDFAPPRTPDAFREIIADDMKKWLPLVKASGAKVD